MKLFKICSVIIAAMSNGVGVVQGGSLGSLSYSRTFGRLLTSTVGASDAICSGIFHDICNNFESVAIDFGDNGIGDNTFCPAGKFNTDEDGSCEGTLPFGFRGIVNEGGLNRMAICNAGAICDGKSDRTCKAGFFCPRDQTNSLSGATLLTREVACPAGKFSSVTGATSSSTCQSCAAGKFSGPGASSCSPCTAGTSSGAGASSCAPCAAGKFSASGASTCSPCTAGTFSAASATKCTPCEAGKFSASGASTCSPCTAGTFSSVGSSTCQNCLIGTFSGAGAANCTSCAAGFFCPSTNSSSAIECPYGFFCPSGSGKPSALSSTLNGNQDKLASDTTPACTAGINCYRYLLARPIQIIKDEDNTFPLALLALSSSNTVLFKEKDGLLIKEAGSVAIAGGRQLIIECNPLSFFQLPLEIGEDPLLTSITIENFSGNVYNKIVFRHCLVMGGKIILGKRAVLILDDSSIAIQQIDISQATVQDPAFIVMKDKSHIAGLVPPIDSKLVIIQDGSTPNSIIGCDQMLSCNQALFVNNTRKYPPNSVESFNSINPLVPNTTELTIPSSAIADDAARKKAALQSLLTCGLLGSNIHLPSTYLGRAIFCSKEADNNQISFINATKTLSLRALKIAQATNNEDAALIENAHQATLAQIELSNSGNFTSSQVLVVPPVTAEFLFRDPQLSFGLPKLIGTLDTVSDKVEELTANLQKSIQEILFQVGFTVKLNSIDANNLNNFLLLFQTMKKSAVITKENVDFELKLAQEEKDACFAKFNNVLAAGGQHKAALDKLIVELPPIVEEVIKDAKKAAFFKALIRTIKFGLELGEAYATGGASAAARRMLASADDADDDNDPIGTANTGIGIMESGIEVYDAWNAFAELKNARSDSSDLKPAIATVDKIATGLNNAKSALNDFTIGKTKNLDALTIPVSEAQLLEIQLTSALDPLGCSFRDNDAQLDKGCTDAESAIHAITLLLVEALQSLSKLLEVTLKVELLQFESNQFQIAIDSWNDAIQKVLGNARENVEKSATEINNLNERLKFVLNLMQSALSRAQVHSLVMINNAVNGLRTICRAAAYQFPNFLEGKVLNFNTACLANIKPELSHVKDRLDSFSKFMETKWIQETGTKTAASVILDVTDLVNITQLQKQPELGAQFLLTPNSFKDKITGDDSFKCMENVDLLFANVFLMTKTGAVKVPLSSTTQFTSFVTVRSPNERMVNGKRYRYDLDATKVPPRFQFRTDVTFADTNPFNIFKPDRVFFNKEVFASMTPFGSYFINFRNYPIANDDKIVILLRVLPHIDLSTCLSNTATSTPSRRMLHDSKPSLLQPMCSLLNGNEYQCGISNECLWNHEMKSCEIHPNHYRSLAAAKPCSSSKSSNACKKNKLCFWDSATSICLEKAATMPPTRMTPPEKISLRLKAANGQWVRAKSNGVIDCNGGTSTTPPANTTFTFSFRFQQNKRNIYYIKLMEAVNKYAWMRVKEDGKNHLVISMKSDIEFTMASYMNEIEAYSDGKISISTNEYKYLSCKSDASIVADVNQVDSKFKPINPGPKELFQVVLV